MHARNIEKFTVDFLSLLNSFKNLSTSKIFPETKAELAYQSPRTKIGSDEIVKILFGSCSIVSLSEASHSLKSQGRSIVMKIKQTIML